MAGRAGRLARVRVSGTAVAFTDEATTSLGDNIRYQVTNAAKRVWDRSVTILVEEDGVATVESYTVNRLTGVVTFALADAGRGAVTVTGSYLPLSEAANAHAYRFSGRRGAHQDNAFGDAWESYQAGSAAVSGSLSRWVVDALFADALVTGAPVVLEFMSDRNAAQFVRVWAVLNAEQMASAVDGVSDEAVEFAGAADADNRQVSN